LQSSPSPWIRWDRLAVALLLAAAVLWTHRGVFWRPFDNTPQDSVASMHAYGFAAANGAGLGWNPIVARHIDVGRSEIEHYPHWPNGFFLLLEGVLRVFGRTEAAGRWLAVSLSVVGITLVAASLGRQDWLLYACIPAILLSNIGRDAVPVVFLDSALLPFLGALLASSGSGPAFRVLLVVGLCFNQLLLPFAAAMVLLRWIETRSALDLVWDVGILAGAGAWVLAALVGEPGSGESGAGLGEIRRIFAARTVGSWSECLGALHWDLRLALHIGPAGSVLAAAAWLGVMGARQWRTGLLLPAAVLYSLLFGQYVTAHRFARLPFVFLALVTLAVAAELLLERLPGRLKMPARLALAGLLGLRLAAAGPIYQADPRVEATRAGLMRMLANPETARALAPCNAFEFRWEEHRWFNPEDRMAQFFFAPRVVERIRRREPVRRCLVDLVKEEARPVSAPDPPPRRSPLPGP